MTAVDTDLGTRRVSTIRVLCMDAIQRQFWTSGYAHGHRPVAYTLWQWKLRFDPNGPVWPNRDRFVLAEGHASTLLWSLPHLSGARAVDPGQEVPGTPAVSLDDLKSLRQLGSECPGRREYRWTSGALATKGPLGQGVATSAGMAIAGAWPGARYDSEGCTLLGFDVYALAGDGCMMEGISSEAASPAGHQRLSDLCWSYDPGRVTIEGHTDITFTEDVAARFIAYGWNVTTVADANDLRAVAPLTVNTMPAATPEAFFGHGDAGETLPADGGQCDGLRARFADAGIDTKEVARKLQADGAKSFIEAWQAPVGEDRR